MAGKRNIKMYANWPRPIFATVVKTNKNFKSNYQGALMYAHYELTSKELKRETVKYLKSLDPRHPMLERIADMNEDRFSTVGKYMYILNHAGDVPEDIMDGLMPALEKIIEEEEIRIITKEKNATPVVIDNLEKIHTNIPVPTIQDRLREKTREVAGEVEGWIDDFYLARKTAQPKTVEEFANLFKANELKGPHMRFMYSIFERRTDEIERAYEGKDKDLNEGYSNFTKIELRKFSQFHKNLLSACVMLQEAAKVERAPRKKKPVSTEKIVSKLKYKKEDSMLGIVSLNPTQILGAKEVWAFNTKTRKISRFIADDLQGPLSVKGTSLIGYNEAKSISKNLRKPVEQLAEFKKSGKVQLRTFMDSIKAVEIKANGRMNEDIVILKVLI